MGTAPCCSKVGLHLRRGPWTANEDALLTKYVQANGEGNWKSVPTSAGLLRCGKSCRLRWMNYLRPDIKRGSIEPAEEELIIRLHTRLGNRWSLIAALLPGRTDNGIKNYWNAHLSKKLKRLRTETIDQDHDPQPSGKINIQEPPEKKRKSKHKDTVRKKPLKMTQTSKIKTNQGNALNVSHLGEDENVASGPSGNVSGEAEDGLDFAWPPSFSTQATVLMDGSLDFPHQFSQIPTKDAMLEEAYQEYLQLLEADRKAALRS